MKIDKIDQQLILDLQKNGRRSYIDLAKNLKVSEGTARGRLKKLVDNGIVKISAVPDLDKLGYSFMGIVGIQVRLSDLREVADKLIQNPNVCFLANVTGRYEFIARVVSKSADDFARFMENVISNIPSIQRTETFVTLHIHKGHMSGLDTTALVNSLEVLPPEKA